MVELEKLQTALKREKITAEQLAQLIAKYERDKKNAELKSTIVSVTSQLKAMHKTLPPLIEAQTLPKPLPQNSIKTATPNAISGLLSEPQPILLKPKSKGELLHELNIERGELKKIKKRHKEKPISAKEWKKPSQYVKTANSIFGNIADRWVKKGYFNTLREEIIYAKLPYLLRSYVSVMLFTSLIVSALSFALFLFLLFFSVSFNFPFVLLYGGAFLTRFLQVFWIIFILPLAAFVLLYFYPSSEKGYLGKKIDEEMPFLTIHMSAIAGSNVEPTEIFKILATTEEYPHAKKEMIVLLNKINIYGMNLASALRDSARYCPSRKLKDLFNGLSTTITSGGSLKNFLEERGKSLLFEYKLDRDKQNKAAETFIDIYISVVIAAPMIFMLLMILISLTGLGGLNPQTVTVLIIGAVAIVNILFLTVMHLKQPQTT